MAVSSTTPGPSESAAIEAVVCPACQRPIAAADPAWRLRLCPACGHHLTMSAAERIASLADPGSFQETNRALVSADPLTFADTRSYPERLAEAQERTGLTEAVVTGTARIGGHPCVLIVCDFNFLGGSMGSVVGEKVALALELAADRRLPCIAICSSGGARMQEGMLSLVQMAKTSAAAVRLHQERVPFVSVLTNPTTGGVYASFATQADIILAEPGALIGFAGPRVVEQTTGERLPPGSHTAEFVLEHGQIDGIVVRTRLRGTLATLLGLFAGGRAPEPPRHEPAPAPGAARPSAWATVQLARRPDRPTTADYLRELMPNFIELHGDRVYGDDPAVICGLGSLDGVPLVVIGQERGHGDERRRGGRMYPEGYRKALRVMRLAAHLRLPLLTLIDTPGAYPGLPAEERNLAGALSQALGTLSILPVPVITVVIGEGGSGGALALGVADRILMLEHAIYAVIAPEGAAAILYRDAERAEEIAAALKLTAHDCLALGVIDGIVPEPAGGAHHDPRYAALQVKAAVLAALGELQRRGERRLLEERYRKFRRMGQQTADARAVVAREIAELQQEVSRRLGGREAVAREIGESIGELQQSLTRRLGQWWTLRPRFGASSGDEAAELAGDEAAEPAGGEAAAPAPDGDGAAGPTMHPPG
jgi:acetyl-CoA carboxylase carboxyl transferase subunit beta